MLRESGPLLWSWWLSISRTATPHRRNDDNIFTWIWLYKGNDQFHCDANFLCSYDWHRIMGHLRKRLSPYRPISDNAYLKKHLFQITPISKKRLSRKCLLYKIPTVKIKIFKKCLLYIFHTISLLKHYETLSLEIHQNKNVLLWNNSNKLEA